MSQNVLNISQASLISTIFLSFPYTSLKLGLYSPHLIDLEAVIQEVKYSLKINKGKTDTLTHSSQLPAAYPFLFSSAKLPTSCGTSHT